MSTITMDTPTTELQGRRANINILLIEDNEADVHLFESTVKQHFPQSSIQTACDGKEAIYVLDKGQFSPDVIFLDINMPRMNGHEFLAAYGDTITTKAIPVYVLTSADLNNGRDQVLFSPYPCIIQCCEKSANLNQIVDVLSNCPVRRLKLVVDNDRPTLH